MKSAYYVAVVTRTYRQALDALMQQKEKYKCRQEWIDELMKISNRGYTTGFAFSEEKINETNPEIKYIQTHEPAGTVLQYDSTRKRILLSVRNRIKADDHLEILLPEDIVAIETAAMTDQNGNKLSEAHSGSEVYLPFKCQVPVGVLARQQIKSIKEDSNL
jgi:putative protease